MNSECEVIIILIIELLFLYIYAFVSPTYIGMKAGRQDEGKQARMRESR